MVNLREREEEAEQYAGEWPTKPEHLKATNRIFTVIVSVMKVIFYCGSINIAVVCILIWALPLKMSCHWNFKLSLGYIHRLHAIQQMNTTPYIQNRSAIIIIVFPRNNYTFNCLNAVCKIPTIMVYTK